MSVSGSTGFVLVGDPTDDACPANSIAGSLAVSHSTAGVEVSRDTKIGRSVTLTNNGGAGPFPDDVVPEVEANKIIGNLSCSGNTGMTRTVSRTP